MFGQFFGTAESKTLSKIDYDVLLMYIKDNAKEIEGLFRKLSDEERKQFLDRLYALKSGASKFFVSLGLGISVYEPYKGNAYCKQFLTTSYLLNLSFEYAVSSVNTTILAGLCLTRIKWKQDGEIIRDLLKLTGNSSYANLISFLLSNKIGAYFKLTNGIGVVLNNLLNHEDCELETGVCTMMHIAFSTGLEICVSRFSGSVKLFVFTPRNISNWNIFRCCFVLGLNFNIFNV